MTTFCTDVCFDIIDAYVYIRYNCDTVIQYYIYLKMHFIGRIVQLSVLARTAVTASIMIIYIYIYIYILLSGRFRIGLRGAARPT